MNSNNPYLKKVRGTRREITCSMVAEAEILQRRDHITHWGFNGLGGLLGGHQGGNMAALAQSYAMAQAQYRRCPHCGK